MLVLIKVGPNFAKIPDFFTKMSDIGIASLYGESVISGITKANINTKLFKDD